MANCFGIARRIMSLFKMKDDLSGNSTFPANH